MEFTGRAHDLAVLDQQWQTVTDGTAASRGRAVVMTGRRRVGKSRLAQQFVDSTDAPSLVFQATRGRAPAAERADFAAAIATSSLTGRDLVAGLPSSDWNQALRLLAMALPDDVPSLVVLDEVPWLVAEDGEFEGALQTVWDRQLSAKPVLLLLIGSDASAMAALQSHERAFFGRAATMVVDPLPVCDVQDACRLAPADAIDAWLVTGGFPEIVASWRAGTTLWRFVEQSLANPLSPLLVSGQLTLLGEFPAPALSRAVLEAVGSGERTFSAIANAVGRVDAARSGTISPILRTLEARGALASELPLSTVPDTRNRRYRVADPYLRFWLMFGPASVALADRGHADVAVRQLRAGWPSWRGRAIEPFVRDSLRRLLPDDRWPDATSVGGWWNRLNNPEIDLVGADRSPVAKRVVFVGSIKWRDGKAFGARDYADLVRAAPSVPGFTATTPLVAVSRAGQAEDVPLARVWGPQDLVDAWR